VQVDKCLLDAPDKKAVELHHLKARLKCDGITQVKMTVDSYDSHNFSISDDNKS
jgi:hypothetical protein